MAARDVQLSQLDDRRAPHVHQVIVKRCLHCASRLWSTICTESARESSNMYTLSGTRARST